MAEVTTVVNLLQMDAANAGTEPSDYALAHPVTYYRSQAFSVQTGLNPLITAATPLFTLAGKLTQAVQQQDLFQLRENLAHEIRAFVVKAQSMGCRQDAIMAARFAVCALLDELLRKQVAGSEKYLLLPLFQHKDNPDDYFFVVLTRLLTEPKLYLDILELMYLCLSLGFVGKFGNQPNGLQARVILMEDLYHVIRVHRGEFSKYLTQTTAIRAPRSEKKSTSGFNFKIACIGAVVILGSVYLGINYLLSLTSIPINQGLLQITKALEQSNH